MDRQIGRMTCEEMDKERERWMRVCMYRQKDRWTGEWTKMDGGMDRQTDRWTKDRQKEICWTRKTVRPINRRSSRRTVRQTDKLTDR